jgi:PAS domain S-box-containing protein
MDKSKTKKQLLQEVEDLRTRLGEAEETLRAIRSGEVDALVVDSVKGSRVYTLESADRLYRILLETLEEGAGILGGDGTVLYGNRRLAEMLRTPLEKVIGASLGNFLSPEDWGILKEMGEGGKGDGLRAEVGFNTGDGKRLPALVSLGRMEAGNFQGVCFTAADLTEQKQAEEALRRSRDDLDNKVRERTEDLTRTNRMLLSEIHKRNQAAKALRRSEERLALAASGTGIGIFEWDVAGGRVLWTRQHDIIFGYRAEDTTTTTTTTTTAYDYRHWADRVHPEDLPRVEEKARRCLEEGKPFDFQYRIVWPDGSVHWMQSKGIVAGDDPGQASQMMGIAQDITERKRTEEELRRSEALFKLLSKTAGRLLQTENPQAAVEELCREVMAHLDCQVFFNFLAAEGTGRLHLNAYAGIPEEEARRIEWLDYGVAVCGCVARDGLPILAADIFNIPDPRTELVKSYGIQAYACHPLKIGDRLIGTLSFGTKTRPRFSPEDVALMKTVTNQVSEAMEKIRLVQELQKSRDELEKRVQERTEELTQSQKRLQQLASQLLRAQEGERKRVAVELHDGLLSELAATKFLLEGKVMLLDRGLPVDPGDLRRIADILGGAMKEARRVMNNLHPSTLDELGLIATMGWLCGEYQKAYPHIAVRKEISVSEGEIAAEVRVVVYRVLQEALNNFARHGKGDRIEISLGKFEGGFCFEIRDNGQGFDVDTAPRGLGLESMRERVEVSGGDFRIQSAIGQGTSIRAIWTCL